MPNFTHLLFRVQQCSALLLASGLMVSCVPQAKTDGKGDKDETTNSGSSTALNTNSSAPGSSMTNSGLATNTASMGSASKSSSVTTTSNQPSSPSSAPVDNSSSSTSSKTDKSSASTTSSDSTGSSNSGSGSGSGPDNQKQVEITGHRIIGEHCDKKNTKVIVTNSKPDLPADYFQVTADDAVMDARNRRTNIECGIELELRWPKNQRIVANFQEDGSLSVDRPFTEGQIGLDTSWIFGEKSRSDRRTEQVSPRKNISRDYEYEWSESELDIYSDCSGKGKITINLRRDMGKRRFSRSYDITIDQFSATFRTATSSDKFVPDCK